MIRHCAWALASVSVVVLAMSGCSASKTENTGHTAESISLGIPDPDPNDPRQFAVVDFGSNSCTGTLISPRLVLTAAHCFGLGGPTSATRGISGGDGSCEVEQTSDGTLAAFGGCGQVKSFDGTTATIKHVWTNVAQFKNGPPSLNAADLAIAVLDQRLIGPGKAVMRPWLDPEDGQDQLPQWQDREVGYFGWGYVQAVNQCSDIQPPSPTLATSLSAFPFGFGDSPLTNEEPFGANNFVGGLMFFNETEANSPGLTLPGDSGGPLLTDTPNGPRVIGVTHGYWCNSRTLLPLQLASMWARVMDFATGNAAFIRRYSYRGNGQFWGDDTIDSTSDPDHDGVATLGPERAFESESDNCPNDYNPDQLDQDSDGIGDACDHCSGTPDDGTDSNLEAEEVKAGVGPKQVTVADPAAPIAFNNSNFPADVCDTQAITAPAGGPGSGASFAQNGPSTFAPGNAGRVETCVVNGHSSICPTVSTTGLSNAPFANQPAPSWDNATQGWRRCHCLTPENAAACESQCPRLAPSFFNDTQHWIPLAVEGGDLFREIHSPVGNPAKFTAGNNGIMGFPIPPIAYDVRWLWWADNTIPQPLPPLPDALHPNLNIGGTLGRLWWYVPHINGARIDVAKAPTAILDSVFTPIEVDEQSAQGLNIIREEKVKSFEAQCIECGSGVRLFGFGASVDPTPTEKVVAIQEHGLARVDVTNQFDSLALSALAAPGGQLLPAEEPGYRASAPLPSFAVLDAQNNVSTVLFRNAATGQIFGLGQFHQGGGGTDIPHSAVASTSSVPVGPGFQIALSARRSQLIGVGSTTGAAASEIWTAPADPNGSWSSLPVLHGPTFGHVDGLTMLASTGLFYALDESREARRCEDGDEDKHEFGFDWGNRADRFDEMHRRHHGPDRCSSPRVRLLAIDPENQVVREVASWTREQGTSLSITASFGDSLLISSSGHGGHTFVVLALTGERITAAQFESGRGEISVSARATRQGIAWGQLENGVTVANSLPLANLRPASPHDVASCF